METFALFYSFAASLSSISISFKQKGYCLCPALSIDCSITLDRSVDVQVQVQQGWGRSCCSWPSLKWISGWICCGCVSLASSSLTPTILILLLLMLLFLVALFLLTAFAFMSSGQHKHFTGCRAAEKSFADSHGRKKKSPVTNVLACECQCQCLESVRL